jgi:hypothetical protein
MRRRLRELRLLRGVSLPEPEPEPEYDFDHPPPPGQKPTPERVAYLLGWPEESRRREGARWGKES